jgi:hypothetical protein
VASAEERCSSCWPVVAVFVENEVELSLQFSSSPAVRALAYDNGEDTQRPEETYSRHGQPFLVWGPNYHSVSASRAGPNY